MIVLAPRPYLSFVCGWVGWGGGGGFQYSWNLEMIERKVTGNELTLV
jgi:hypothetical protein